MKEVVLKREVAIKIEDAQIKLHEAVYKALVEFTAETGLNIPSMYWQVATACDENGHTKGVDYYGMRSDLRSSVY